MKEAFCILMLFIFTNLFYAQNNTFPTSGNVGIGTSSPSAKLDVRVGGWNNFPRILFSQSADNPSIRLYRPTGTAKLAYPWWIENHLGKLTFKSGTSTNVGSENVNEKVTFLNNGYVGIGTTNPSTKLAIEGDNESISVAFNSYNYSTTQPIGAKLGTWNDTNAAGIKFHRWLGSGTLFHSAYIGQAHHNGDYGLDFRTDNVSTLTDATTSRMYISGTTGNVGIGITNPTEKLEVNGSVHTKEVRVDLTGWPDYVFEKEYKLPTLKEVEKHIKENGHLQNIPSAEVVEKDGIKLGEMNAKLLQKIEELTLYIIQQNKRIERLELENTNDN